MMDFIYSIFNWYMDIHIIFQVVIGFFVVCVLLAIIDSVFGITRKDEIKKMVEKFCVPEEKLQEIVESLGGRYPDDLIKEDTKLHGVKGISDVEELHIIVSRIIEITEKFDIPVKQLETLILSLDWDYPRSLMRYSSSIAKDIEESICPSCSTIGSFCEKEDESYISSDARLLGRKNIEDENDSDVTRNMEIFERIRHKIYSCNKCSYTTELKKVPLEYNVHEIAAEGYRCPKCNERNSVYLKEIKQVDRYQANKEVEETNSRGSKTRYIKIMKTIEEETYCCKNCDFVSMAMVTRELN